MRNLFQNLLFPWYIKYNYIITSFSFLKLHTKILLSFLYYKTRILNQFPKFIFYFITSNINTKIIKFLLHTSTIKNSNYFQILLLHLLITIITVIKYTNTYNETIIKIHFSPPIQIYLNLIIAKVSSQLISAHFFQIRKKIQSIVLTNVETVRSIPLWREREAITVFIGFQMPDATLKSGPHRKSLEAGCVSRSADEQWLAEGNSRKQALQSNPEQPGSRICGKSLYNSRFFLPKKRPLSIFCVRTEFRVRSSFLFSFFLLLLFLLLFFPLFQSDPRNEIFHLFEVRAVFREDYLLKAERVFGKFWGFGEEFKGCFLFSLILFYFIISLFCI